LDRRTEKERGILGRICKKHKAKKEEETEGKGRRKEGGRSVEYVLYGLLFFLSHLDWV